MYVCVYVCMYKIYVRAAAYSLDCHEGAMIVGSTEHFSL